MNADGMAFDALKRLRIGEVSFPVDASAIRASFVRKLENIFYFPKPNTVRTLGHRNWSNVVNG